MDIIYDGPGDDYIYSRDDDNLDTLCTADGETIDVADAGDVVTDDPALAAIAYLKEQNLAVDD